MTAPGRFVVTSALPRPWAWLRARLGGYFWLPCPQCAQMFGGHEIHVDDRPQLIRADDKRPRRIMCPRCERLRADERHADYLALLDGAR